MKKGVIIGIVVVFSLLISVSFVSAGFVDWLKDIFGVGEDVRLSPEDSLVAYWKFDETSLIDYTIAMRAYNLDQQYGLFLDKGYSYNWGGHEEKWMKGNNGLWYIILPDGKLYHWTGAIPGSGFITGSIFISELDGSYHTNPTKLHNAIYPPAEIIDSTGFGHDGVNLGVTPNPDGMIDGALMFDGINQYINIPFQDGLKPTNEITVCSWINLEGDNGYVGDHYELIMGTSGGGYQLIYFEQSDKIQLWIFDGDWGTPAESDIGYDGTEGWIHVCGVHTANSVPMIYINGVAQSTVGNTGRNSGVQGDIVYGDSNFYIGVSSSFESSYKGLLDELRIYERVLTSDEITEIYNERGAPKITITNPIDNVVTSDRDLDIHYTINKDNLDSCWYSYDNFISIIPLVNCQSISTITWSEGDHNVVIFAKDTDGLEGQANVSFTIDTITPEINIVSPIDGLISSDPNLEILYNVVDENLDFDSCKYSEDGLTFLSFANCDDITDVTWSEGVHNVTIYATDLTGVEGQASVVFTIDTTSPTVVIDSPKYDAVSIDAGMVVSYTASDVNLDSCWFTDNDSDFIEILECRDITGYTWSRGVHDVTVYVLDAVGHEDSDSVRFTIECNGCVHESNCIPYGIRLLNSLGEDTYCDVSKELRLQKGDEADCQNDYECFSNECSAGICINTYLDIIEDSGLILKIWCRLSNLPILGASEEDYLQCLLVGVN